MENNEVSGNNGQSCCWPHKTLQKWVPYLSCSMHTVMTKICCLQSVTYILLTYPIKFRHSICAIVNIVYKACMSSGYRKTGSLLVDKTKDKIEMKSRIFKTSSQDNKIEKKGHRTSEGRNLLFFFEFLVVFIYSIQF